MSNVTFDQDNSPVPSSFSAESSPRKVVDNLLAQDGFDHSASPYFRQYSQVVSKYQTESHRLVQQMASSSGDSRAAILDYFDKNVNALEEPPRSEDYTGVEGDHAVKTVVSNKQVVSRLAKDFGIVVSDKFIDNVNKLEIESVDKWPRKKAVNAIRVFLNQHYESDDDKCMALTLILKHYALNSTSNRAPDETQYKFGRFELSMREFGQYIGVDLRRCMRALADDIANAIRNDPALKSAIAGRYGVPTSDAEYYFDVADARTRLTPHMQAKIASHKAAILNRTNEYDARPIARVESDNAVETHDVGSFTRT